MKKIIFIVFSIFILVAATSGIAYAMEQDKLKHTPPSGTIVSITSGYGQELTPDVLVNNVMGNEPIAITFAKEPDVKKIGIQMVDILLTDCYGNTSIVSSYLNVTPVKAEVTAEASKEPLDIDLFLYDSSVPAEFSSSSGENALEKPGNYSIYIKCNGRKYASSLTVEDTTSPTVFTKDLTVWPFEEVKAEDFIRSYEDASPVSFSFAEEPDTGIPGTYALVIKCIDSAGNISDATAKLMVKKDTEAPVFQGVRDIEVSVGDSVSYKQGVTATDIACGNIDFTVDASQVDLTKEGTYEAVYSATDLSGNTATQTITVTVTEISDYTEKVNALCDDILRQITTAGMSKSEKAKAVFTYVLNNITYIGHSDKSDWVKGAYTAFTRKQGDCYTYYAASRALLTRLGIENMEVIRIGETHFWNLVNLGSGWYHFDASPKSSNFQCFMLTDEEVAAYGPSIGRPEYYDFDKSLYPSTPAEKFEKK